MGSGIRGEPQIHLYPEPHKLVSLDYSWRETGPAPELL